MVPDQLGCQAARQPAMLLPAGNHLALYRATNQACPNNSTTNHCAQSELVVAECAGNHSGCRATRQRIVVAEQLGNPGWLSSYSATTLARQLLWLPGISATSDLFTSWQPLVAELLDSQDYQCFGDMVIA
ncbi:hypothetical protein Fot_19948 [Forsythia ovata]|uniref:Uncharacterized protein n=1 Tax=Forsythia ovata TaxID=205694 RepID=A0ABD1VMG7_9LAMI